MTEVAIISDTHIPSRASAIPDRFEALVREADHTIHAGDFTDPATIEHVRDLADGNLTAVVGNMDRGLDVPFVDSVTLEGVTFVVTHGTGDREGYEERVVSRVRESADDEAIGVAGHTHELMDTVYDGIRILNPGSVTGAPPADRTTMLTATVENGSVAVTRHEL